MNKSQAFDPSTNAFKGNEFSTNDVRLVDLHEVEFELSLEEYRSLREAKYHALLNSRRLDVHTWSEHPEVNAFVTAIYDAYFNDRKQSVTRTHLKVVLLDLYVTWCQDPARSVAFSRNNNDYLAGSIYNELHISRKTINVVDVLIDADLILQAIGYHPSDESQGMTSRIWPSQKLISMFEDASFTLFDVGNHPDRLAVILRSKHDETNEKDEVEYEPTNETRSMEAVLAKYNSLLERTFIDIPSIEEPTYRWNDSRAKPPVTVSQSKKFTRRIFNRGSFACGGRFWGGWWQRCPKEWRPQIFINNHATNEIDFSGFHVVILYAQQGINYWDDIGEDPYTIPTPNFLDDEKHSRSIAKSLMLMLLNAVDAKSAYSAFRRNADTGSLEKQLTNPQLALVHDALIERHGRIAEFFGADAGVHLMNEDAKITERIIEHFTDRDVPVLSIHDSYIIPAGLEDEMVQVMAEAFHEVTGVSITKNLHLALKEEKGRYEFLESRLLSLTHPYPDPERDRLGKDFIDMFHPTKTKRYEQQWSTFRAWREKKATSKEQSDLDTTVGYRPAPISN